MLGIAQAEVSKKGVTHPSGMYLPQLPHHTKSLVGAARGRSGLNTHLSRNFGAGALGPQIATRGAGLPGTFSLAPAVN